MLKKQIHPELILSYIVCNIRLLRGRIYYSDSPKALNVYLTAISQSETSSQEKSPQRLPHSHQPERNLLPGEKPSTFTSQPSARAKPPPRRKALNVYLTAISQSETSSQEKSPQRLPHSHQPERNLLPGEKPSTFTSQPSARAKPPPRRKALNVYLTAISQSETSSQEKSPQRLPHSHQPERNLLPGEKPSTFTSQPSARAKPPPRRKALNVYLTAISQSETSPQEQQHTPGHFLVYCRPVQEFLVCPELHRGVKLAILWNIKEIFKISQV